MERKFTSQLRRGSMGSAGVAGGKCLRQPLAGAKSPKRNGKRAARGRHSCLPENVPPGTTRPTTHSRGFASIRGFFFRAFRAVLGSPASGSPHHHSASLRVHPRAFASIRGINCFRAFRVFRGSPACGSPYHSFARIRVHSRFRFFVFEDEDEDERSTHPLNPPQFPSFP